MKLNALEKSIVEKYLLSNLLNESIFFPYACEYVCDMKDVYKIDCKDAILFCKYFKVENPIKTIIVFYGNGECVQNYLPQFPIVFKYLNCNLLLVEYRGYGMSSGIPTLLSIMQDVHYIIKAIDFPIEKIILYGRSIGLFPVIEGIKHYPQLGGVIFDSCNICPEETLTKRVKFSDNENKELISKAISMYFGVKKTLMKFQGKSLILHTLDDTHVPFSNALILKEYLKNKSELKVFEHGGHNGIISMNAKEYFLSIQRFLKNIDN